MRRVASMLFIALLACCPIQAQSESAQARRTRDNISGHYALRYSNVRSRLDVQLLPNNQIKFSLVALLETGGNSPRNGIVEATVALKNGVAVYEQGECKISMKFINNKAVVRESHVDDCGFGAFVTAEGTYLRKSRKPLFNS